MEVSGTDSYSWWPFWREDNVEFPAALPQESPAPIHPYYPLGVNIPSYVPNDAPVTVLLGSLAGMLGFAVLGAAVIARRFNANLSKSDLAVFCWFVMNGCLHCVFEGTFVLHHATLASSQGLLAQLWKEYALSDSRYLTSDFFMLSIESITVFVWGPLCFTTAVTIVRDSPVRHVLQIMACMAHLYGIALYYATSLCELYFSGRSHSRPEFLYFWVYYVGFNLPWAIVPTMLLLSSTSTVARAMRALHNVDETLSNRRRSSGGLLKQDLVDSKKTK